MKTFFKLEVNRILTVKASLQDNECTLIEELYFEREYKAIDRAMNLIKDWDLKVDFNYKRNIYNMFMNKVFQSEVIEDYYFYEFKISKIEIKIEED